MPCLHPGAAGGGSGQPGHAIGWRVWASLVKVWASLRWSDLQATISAELSFVEGRWLQGRGPGQKVATTGPLGSLGSRYQKRGLP